jgi:hypothetical protein
VGQGRRFKSRGLYFFYGKLNENCQSVRVFFVNHRILSVVKKVEFVNGRMSYIVLRGRWCNITLLKCMHQRRKKVMIQKNSFYEELE